MRHKPPNFNEEKCLKKKKTRKKISGEIIPEKIETAFKILEADLINVINLLKK